MTYTIKARMSNTGSIHDLASDTRDRDIVFASSCKYAVVLAAYYGGKGYTTHKTEEAVCRQARKVRAYSYGIIDREGHYYACDIPNGLVYQITYARHA